MREKKYPLGSEDPTKGWDGVVKELMDLKADFAISDITINEKRKKAIDFSVSFQTLGNLRPFSSFSCDSIINWKFIFPFIWLGVGILFSKPEKHKAGKFAFMDPLEPNVWLYTGTAILFVCIVEWLLAKYCYI